MRLSQVIREQRANRRRRALSQTVWELPIESRQAMLRALEDEELIVGAYVDRHGRMCPTVAAFRRGARACVGGFPKAWDDFAQARRPRPATQRERQILRALLEESLVDSRAATPQAHPDKQPILAET